MAGQLYDLELRDRRRARYEDRIRCAKDTGLGRLPSRSFTVNAAWLTATMIAVDLLAFTQTLLLHNTELARAEPKTLRYRLLHVAAPSPAANAASGYASTNTGPGHGSSPPHSPAWPRCPSPPANPPPQPDNQTESPAEQHAGHHVTPTPAQKDQQSPLKIA